MSRNRFPEVPEAAGQLVSLEGLSLYHNCLRCLNPALGNLTALTYLNLSALASLRQLDASSNELQSLPAELCGLPSLRDLKLGDLPLVRLDFSCNRVSRIPVSFCRLRHLQVILLDSNPLQSPPAQICLKGKLHIFKYLSTEAGRREGSALGDLAPSRPPTDGDPEQVDFIDSHVPGEDEERGAGEVRGARVACPSTMRELEEGSQCRLGEPPQPLCCSFFRSSGHQNRALWQGMGRGHQAAGTRSHLRRRLLPVLHRAALCPLLRPRSTCHPASAPQAGGAVRGGEAAPRHLAAVAGARAAAAAAAAEWRSSSALTPALGLSLRAWEFSGQLSHCVENPTSAEAGDVGARPCDPATKSMVRSPSSPDSVLRPRRSPQLLDEKEVMAQLRQVLESQLQRPLPEDLAEALASGVILCQLANQLRPRSVPFIHVPSPAVPKLSALKSRKNVESFLEACRKMGVPEADLCSPSDLLQGTAQGLWTTLEAVKRAGGRSPPPLWPPSGLGGFILFYVVLMLLLCVVYTRLLASLHLICPQATSRVPLTFACYILSAPFAQAPLGWSPTLQLKGGGVPVPAPPHPGRGGGPGKGPPLHRCCHPCTAGTALGVEVRVQGPDPAGTPGTEKTATPGLCSLARTGEGGLGPGPVPRAPVCPGAWKQAGPARREAASGRGRGSGMGDWGLGIVSRAINGSRKPSRLPLRGL
ncbi:hypothetical protein E2I00_014892, partial [Balaenoptera physalus]